MKKKVIISFVIVSILLLTYIASFFKSTDKRKAINTSLLNTKYLLLIKELDISQGDKAIQIVKKNGFWFLNELSGSIPVEEKRVDDFFKELSKPRTAYKIAGKAKGIGGTGGAEKQLDSYGLTDGSELVLRYYFDEPQGRNVEPVRGSGNFYELIFGNHDFSGTSRFFMTGKSAAVYEIDSSLDKYLSTSPQIWYDPYIVSKTIQTKLSYKDIQRIKVDFEGKTSILTTKTESFSEKTSKLLDLRHGGLLEYESIGSPQMTITLEKGDISQIIISIYKTEMDSEYNVEVEHSGAFASDKAGAITVRTKISLWTYNKIKEIML